MKNKDRLASLSKEELIEVLADMYDSAEQILAPFTFTIDGVYGNRSKIKYDDLGLLKRSTNLMWIAIQNAEFREIKK